jgi:hypothetical protein
MVSQEVASYMSKGNGLGALFRQAGRTFAEASTGHLGWIETLPCGDYTSVVCGGLKLVFGAAASMSSLRKKVLEALKYLPDTEIAEEYLREYQENKALAQAAVELYVAILDAIMSMLEWLDRDAYSK